MRKKQLLSTLLAGCLAAASIFPGFVHANSFAETEIARPDTDAGFVSTDLLTRVTAAVKEKVPVPDSLTEFSYGYYPDYQAIYTSDPKECFQLLWKTPDGEKELQVRADSEGRILFYDYTDSTHDSYIPKYKKSSLKTTAEAFLKKAAPDIFDHLSYKGSTFKGTYSGQYLYTWQRVENGIPMPGNTVSVGVNNQTGQVTYFISSWSYGLTIPDGQTSLTKAEAAKKAEKEANMTLQYLSDRSGEKTKAFLAYIPEHTYLSINAKTGEIYNTRAEDKADGSAKEFLDTGSAAEEASDAGGSLTQKEISKIEEIENIISSKKAASLVKNNPHLLFDENLTKITPRLYQLDSSGGPSPYIWNITFSVPAPVDYEKGTYQLESAFASIDAKTGKIYSYYAYASVPSSNGAGDVQSIKRMDKKACQEVFESFSREQLPDYFKNTAKAKVQSDYELGYYGNTAVTRGYQYKASRTYKDIPYEENYILGCVDAVTGKIYSFNYNWDDKVTFQEPESMLSKAQAYASYIQKDGFDLIYEAFPTNKTNAAAGSSEVRLVYNTNIYPYAISPFTGEQLTDSGKPFDPLENQFQYNDLDGHPAYEDIMLLADMGIGFSEKSFKPGQPITVPELKKFFQGAGLYTDRLLNTSSSSITRMEAARMAITYLGMEKAAELKDIYQLDYKDADRIKASDFGYAALAKGLGLLEADGENNLNPDSPLTRAEAVSLLLSTIKAR